MLRRLPLLAFLPAIAIAACAQGGFSDAGNNDMDGGRDAGRRDAGRPTDAGRPPDAGPPRDAGRDAGRDGGGTDAGPRDAGYDAGSGGCSPSPTTIAITEVMISSRSGAGDLGEWFEIKNIGSCTVTLPGLVINGTFTASTGFLAPGESYVFAQSGVPAENHGLSHDAVYGSGIAFSNGGGTLTLTYMGSEVDRVTWGSTDYAHGASRQLSSDASPTSNDNLGAIGVWCNSTAVYSSDGGTFLGTPQSANALCP